MSAMTKSELVASASKLAMENQAALMAAPRCGCYHCTLVFQPSDINEWVSDAGGRTALCPRCGVDSVIPETEATGPLTEEVLQAARNAWFSATKETCQ